MARMAEMRPAAEPTSAGQKARYVRIVDAATGLAETHELDRIQMQEVARRAGVAVATLYRYFPSKVHLFVAVMAKEVDLMLEAVPDVASKTPQRVDTVLWILDEATRQMHTKPALAAAMLTAANSLADSVDVRRIELSFQSLLLQACSFTSPSEHELRIVRLIIYMWFSLMQTYFSGRRTWEDCRVDLVTTVELLLRPSND